jgi:predicted DNA binding CopG/RHH family protein
MEDDTTNVRVSKESLKRLKAAADTHPYKPTIRALVEHGVDLVIDELLNEPEQGNRND